MKHLFYLLLAGVGLLAGGCSQYDDTDLVNRMDGLEDRLTKLEETIDALNQDIKGVQTMIDALEKNVYVARIEQTEDGYTVYFTDGKQITISNGRDGAQGADAPTVTVKLDEETNVYYWALTQDGVTEYLLDDNGERIPVRGDEGATPLLRVTMEDTTGYWEVSYDEGKTWTRVLDKTGMPVTTSGGAGGLFKSVEEKDGVVIFTLLDDSTIEIELRGDLFMLFDGEAPTEPVAFRMGETKEFLMESTGVKNTVVTTPDEWQGKFDLSTNILSITAPSAEHQTCAAQAGDVAVIYFGDQNQSSVITFKVTIGEFVTVEETLLAQTIEAAGGTLTVPFTADGVVTASPRAEDTWLTASVAGTDLTINVAANQGNTRTGIVTLAAKDNSVEITVTQAEGVATVALGIREGSATELWNTAIGDAGFASPNNSSSIAAIGDYVLVNVPGENPVIFNALSGEKYGTFELGGAPNDLITADDAGHIVLCNYNPDSSGDFEIWRAKDVESAPEHFATYPGGSPVGLKISVTGDIYGDAVIMIPYSAWSADGVTTYWAWEVKNGAVTSEKPSWQQIADPNVIGYKQNIDMISAYNNRSSDFFFVGYSGSIIHWLSSDNVLKAKMPITPAASLANFISNAIDVEVFNNQLYVAITCDNMWGNDRMWVIEATESKWVTPAETEWTSSLSEGSEAVVYSLPENYNVVGSTYYQDCAMRVSDDGLYLYAYYMFGGNALGCVQFDCIAE